MKEISDSWKMSTNAGRLVVDMPGHLWLKPNKSSILLAWIMIDEYQLVGEEGMHLL